MLIMTVEFCEARARMHDVVDAVQQGREVVVTHFREPLAMLRLHGPEGLAPRAWLESVVKEGFDVLAEKVRRERILTSLFGN